LTIVDTDPDIQMFRVLRDDGTADPAHDPHVPLDILMHGYREMRRIRAIDARMIAMQRQGRVGFYGSSQGQEATPIATGLVLEKEDWVFPALREQATMLVRGFPLDQFLAQVFGNKLDVLKGRQMPSHNSGRSVNQVAWGSCIATQIPQAVGCAWAMKLRGTKAVAIGFSGDGGTSEPDFHNAMNFAAVFKVPVVIVVQNNGWSISIPTSKQTASETIAVKGRAYGVPSVRVDGNDLLAVYKILKDAVSDARSGKGPTFVECVTYRMGAHSTSDDPTRYRSEAEVAEWKKKDPLDRLRKHLVGLGAVDDASDAKLEEELGREIAAAIAGIENAPAPARETLFDDVYAELPWNLEEQREELLGLPTAPGHA
jgi:pyruvate dehydrogenase E1 component alpha subunit/2-oxoisovalerate dehydrogenase E1 component alpha subunit